MTSDFGLLIFSPRSTRNVMSGLSLHHLDTGSKRTLFYCDSRATNGFQTTYSDIGYYLLQSSSTNRLFDPVEFS